MNARTCWSLVLACTLNVGSLAAASPGEETVKAMSERLETALVEFDRTLEARQLATVAEELYQLPPQQEAMSSARSFKLRSIVRVLGAVERKIDPTFDPDDSPSRNVAPPGHKYPSGVAPSSISDEKVRKQYESAVAANKAKVAKFNLQVDLHRLKERSVTMLETLAHDADSDKSQSLTELTSLLDQYGINKESRERIMNAARNAK